MKKFQEIETISKRKILQEMACDICHKTVPAKDTWEQDGYDIVETTVKMSISDNYGTEGGSITIYEFDICPDCFVNKLMPWLKSQGATARIKRAEW